MKHIFFFSIPKNTIKIRKFNFLDKICEIQKNVIYTIDTFQNKCSMLQKIVKIYNEESAVLTVDVVKICVHLISNDCEYLCAVPNLHSY